MNKSLFKFENNIKRGDSIESVKLALVKTYELSRDPFSIDTFYDSVENLMRTYNNAGLFPYGDSLVVPLQDGRCFVFSLCDKGAILQMKQLDGSITPLINEEDLATKERTLLTGMSRIFDVAIGRQYPREFSHFIDEQVGVGDTISFMHGPTYVCTQKSTHDIHVIEIPKVGTSFKDHSFELLQQLFEDNNDIVIDYWESKSMQAFYNKVKDAATDNIVPSLIRSKIEFARPLLDRLKCDFEKSGKRAMSFILGSETIYIKKPLFGAPVWLDSHKNVIKEELLKAYIDWLHISPMQITLTDGRDNISDFEKSIDKYHLMEDIESHLGVGQAYNLYQIIKDFCEKAGKEVSVNISGYTDLNNHTFDAVSFVFKLNDAGECVIFSGKHIDNDPNKGLEQLSVVSPERFCEFCVNKMQAQMDVIKANIAQTVLQQAKSAPVVDSATFERIIENAAQSQIERNVKPFSFSDIKPLSQEESALLDLFIEEDDIDDPGDIGD